jgi:hypothetical protein
MPSKEAMEERIQIDEASARAEFSGPNERWRTLINWIPYMHNLAREIRCLSDRQWLLVFRPRLGGFKLLCGPMSSFHYRLTGHCAKPALAEDITGRLPFDARIRDQLFFFGIHSSVALLTRPFYFLACSIYSLLKDLFDSRIVLCELLFGTPWQKKEMNSKASLSGRPAVVRSAKFENQLKDDPERRTTFENYRSIHGDASRFQTSAGMSTFCVCDKNLADSAFKTRELIVSMLCRLTNRKFVSV